MSIVVNSTLDFKHYGDDVEKTVAELKIADPSREQAKAAISKNLILDQPKKTEGKTK